MEILQLVTYNDMYNGGQDRSVECLTDNFDKWLEKYNEERVEDGQSEYGDEEFDVESIDIQLYNKKKSKKVSIYKVSDDFNGESCTLHTGTLKECRDEMLSWTLNYLEEADDEDYTIKDVYKDYPHLKLFFKHPKKYEKKIGGGDLWNNWKIEHIITVEV